jgi:hypothetical protein
MTNRSQNRLRLPRQLRSPKGLLQKPVRLLIARAPPRQPQGNKVVNLLEIILKFSFI